MRVVLGTFAFACAFLVAATPSFGLTLEELSQELAKNPGAQWVAKDSAVAADHRVSGESFFGLPAGYDLHEVDVTEDAFVTPKGAPTAFDWRNVAGVSWMTPVRNQGRCGSCVAFAAVAALEGQYNITGRIAGVDVDFSEQDLFPRIGRCDSGSWPSSAVSTMRSSGTPDEACYPYVSGRLGADQPTSATCADRAQRALKISGSTTVGASRVKEALLNGPLMTTMTVYEDFMFYAGGVYRHVTGSAVGGHAITIVGYDDAAQAFIVKNSWGEDWGERGYFRIAYDDTSGLGRDNYAVTVAAPNTFAKLEGPGHLSALAGVVTLQARSTVAAKSLGQLAYVAEKKGGGGARRDGRFELPTMTSQLDTRQLPDGVYELTLNATRADGTVGRPWYQIVSIANNPQNISVSLAPDFDASRPIRDRVYFKIGATAAAVPLTSVELVIAKTDGSYSRTLTLADPGSEAKLGWRTGLFPNGAYTIKAVGRIGALQAFESAAVSATVAN